MERDFMPLAVPLVPPVRVEEGDKFFQKRSFEMGEEPSYHGS
jgi:hypothetical protein